MLLLELGLIIILLVISVVMMWQYFKEQRNKRFPLSGRSGKKKWKIK